ncbi:hypothetical protein D9M72_277630 [compost metagenome]
MIASICSMSAIMASRVGVSIGDISVSSRSRVSGVRRSCEMPASITTRSSSSWRRSCTIWLKLWLASATSLAPRSGSGGGSPPLPIARAALARRLSG